MFERFTDRARRVSVLAQEEARALGHNYIGTEHILLAVIREGSGAGAQTLDALGMSGNVIRERVEDITGRGKGASQGHIPFTPQAKKALELSLREALQMGCNYIGTEHILLGVLREGDGVAARVLTGLGTDLSQVRQKVTELLRDHSPDNAARVPRAIARPDKGGRRTRRLLGEFGVRLDAIDQRLSALEQRVGIGPDTGDLEARVAEVRLAKEAAIDRQEFEDAAALRDGEKELLLEIRERQAEWRSQNAHLPSLTAELTRLRDLLRQHGIDPHDGTA
jgi:Clp amino terminal domain, pathogenicity island component/UvrB/uvrC motif